jgi:hypothetical protein
LTFYPPKKVAQLLIRVEKNFFKIGHTTYQKKWNFALISKMCRSLVFGKRGKHVFTENLIFKDWENFPKNHFLRKNLWELLDARVLHIFEISAKFRFF